MKKFLTRGLVGVGALAIPLGASLALPLAADAAPASPGHLSFSASKDGASAGWSTVQGSAVNLTLGRTTASYAEITVSLPAAPVSGMSEPTFATDHYTAGSPRWVLKLTNGDTLWGYPPIAGLSTTSNFAWAINNGNTYQPWSNIQATEGSAKVTGAYVIADADQAAGTTDVITNLTFNGTTFN
jgi:hypothetical protein